MGFLLLIFANTNFHTRHYFWLFVFFARDSCDVRALSGDRLRVVAMVLTQWTCVYGTMLRDSRQRKTVCGVISLVGVGLYWGVSRHTSSTHGIIVCVSTYRDVCRISIIYYHHHFLSRFLVPLSCPAFLSGFPVLQGPFFRLASLFKHPTPFVTFRVSFISFLHTLATPY